MSRDERRRAACRAAASTETHGTAQFALRLSIQRLATGNHAISREEMEQTVQENAEIAADYDPRGGA